MRFKIKIVTKLLVQYFRTKIIFTTISTIGVELNFSRGLKNEGTIQWQEVGGPGYNGGPGTKPRNNYQSCKILGVASQ